MPISVTPSKWLYLHIPMLCLSYLMLLAAAGVGFLYIVQENRIKRHKSTAVDSHLPPLDTMELFIYHMILWSFPLLSLGILIGAHWAFVTRGRFWEWDSTETFSLITWLIYLIYLALRWVIGWRGRRSTYLALAGFGIILISLVALFFYSPLHTMGSTKL
jgi:ABC-type transport system involved in cytochrome c biogenesis permease subunit